MGHHWEASATKVTAITTLVNNSQLRSAKCDDRTIRDTLQRIRHQNSLVDDDQDDNNNIHNENSKNTNCRDSPVEVDDYYRNHHRSNNIKTTIRTKSCSSEITEIRNTVSSTSSSSFRGDSKKQRSLSTTQSVHRSNPKEQKQHMRLDRRSTNQMSCCTLEHRVNRSTSTTRTPIKQHQQQQQSHEQDEASLITPLRRNYSTQFHSTAPPPPPLVSPRTVSSSHFLERTSKVLSPYVNYLSLHVYDLISKDTLMWLPPCGCVLQVGQCMANVNSALQELGTGAYHVGIEVNGVEYAYGSSRVPNKTGVFTCYPKRSPGYQYRTTIDLGARPLPRRPLPSCAGIALVPDQAVPAETILQELARDYVGTDYDLLRKNCCTFATDACVRLGVPEREIPSWFRNLAQTGAMTQDVAMAAVIQPIASVLSSAGELSLTGRGSRIVEEDDEYNNDEEDHIRHNNHNYNNNHRNHVQAPASIANARA